MSKYLKKKNIYIRTNLLKWGTTPQSEIEHVLCSISKFVSLFFLKNDISILKLPEKLKMALECQ